jgi:DNA-binding response OmpR family regulator
MMSKPNVLVITQDTTTQDEFKDILAHEFEHVQALNSIDGIALSRMMKPAIVFVDLNVPRLNAVGVCKSLLAHDKVRGIPVFVVADMANVNGELKTLSNFKGVVQRPVQTQDVRSKIQLAIEGKVGETGQVAKKAEAPREGPIRVLSVDDSSVVRKLVTMILTAEGFKVTTASDGVDGINKAKELQPDVILLDFVMPKMNGFQVCRILQKDEKLKKIPVILVTSKGDKVGDKFVDQLGVTGYITKPFQPEELVSKIHQTLEAREAQKTGVAVAALPQPQVAAPAVAPTEAPKPSMAAASTAPAVGQPGSEQLLEEKIATLVKAELNKFMKTLDKRIEKAVIEKMNEYIRRAKKK